MEHALKLGGKIPFGGVAHDDVITVVHVFDGVRQASLAPLVDLHIGGVIRDHATELGGELFDLLIAQFGIHYEYRFVFAL